MSAFPAPTPIRLSASDGAPPITLSTHEMGASPAVVFCHGFPDLAYGWRYQLLPIAAAGDQRR